MTSHIITTQMIVEYLANCAWQIPLLAAAAWLMVRLARPEMRTQYWLWVAVLALAIFLPMQGIGDATASRIYPIATSEAPAQTISHHYPVRPIATLNPATYQAPNTPTPRGFTLHLNFAVTRALTVLYAIAILFAVLRLLRAWLGAQRLIRGASRLHLAPEARRAFEEIAAGMNLALPRLRESREIAGPMVIGALRPVLLLPETARDYDPFELRAALCHELAHIRRHDYLVNLLCEAAMLPVSWHPAAHAIERRIQQTREMICDEIAARSMQSGGDYALCLVSVTRRILARPVDHSRTQAVGFFDKNALEERVMRLTNEGIPTVKEGMAMTHQTKVFRTTIGLTALATVVALSMTCHVKPALAAVAQSAAPATTQTPSVTPTPVPKPSPLVSAAPATPATPLAIARGAHATVTAEKGEYVHLWKSHDGEPFAMVNHDPTEPSEEEQIVVEEKLSDAQELANEGMIKLDMPDIKIRLDDLRIDSAKELLNNAEIKRNMEHARLVLNDPAMRKQMRDLKRLGKIDAEKQIAELKLNPPHIDLDLQLDMANKALLNADIAKSMRESQGQMQDLQKQIESGELKAKLDAATRMLEDVKKQLQEMQAKPK